MGLVGFSSDIRAFPLFDEIKPTGQILTLFWGFYSVSYPIRVSIPTSIDIPELGFFFRLIISPG